MKLEAFVIPLLRVYFYYEITYTLLWESKYIPIYIYKHNNLEIGKAAEYYPALVVAVRMTPKLSLTSNQADSYILQCVHPWRASNALSFALRYLFCAQSECPRKLSLNGKSIVKIFDDKTNSVSDSREKNSEQFYKLTSKAKQNKSTRKTNVFLFFLFKKIFETPKSMHNH